MIFDPLYLLVIGIGFGLSLYASTITKGRFRKYSQYTTRSRMTGADIARSILEDNNIRDVKVERIPGELSDHYDPRTKILRLSEPVYDSNSMAAFGVAAHEVGHAIQHAKSYSMLQFRSAWVPVANYGGGISTFVIILAFVMGGAASATGSTLSWLGVLLFGCTTVFTLVTLPVEFDASKRALVCLKQGNYVTEKELDGARKVLNAAAMTYVAAFITSLLTLLYWAHKLGLLGGRR
jgi:Zn-dependent membrane protease YugP|tara:strand:- start:1537 stop:2244 length:708 start_codon:yes stop_codon:yes gene_type:complete